MQHNNKSSPRQKASKILKFWPIITLLIIEIALFFTNYIPGTFLMGWDNVMPEFNFKANLIRNIFGVWQEHRGLGLYDGMSHIALTIHTLFLWLISVVLPTNILRYVFNLLMHFLGGLGMYFLVRHIYSSNPRRDEKFSPPAGGSNNKIISLLASVFYLFNPATIQMFYTPLESFSVHFMALPWLTLTLLNYLQKSNQRNFIWFLLIVLITTPQYFITTLFLSTLCVILPILITFVIKNHSRSDVRKVLTVIFSFLCINAFWLIPYIYGIPQNAPIIQSANINQMSSQEIFMRNQAFGDIKNILLLRGFSLDYIDLNSQGISQLIMLPWRNFLYQPLITGLAILLSLITLFGLIKFKNNTYLLPFLCIFIIGLVMLGTNIPILKELIAFLRKYVPFFSEIFRFSFTKFSLLFVFAYSIFLVNGILELTKIFKKKAVSYLVSLLIISTFSIPAFQGNFFYQQLKVQLPKSYLNVFNFMLDENPHARVAILPQPEFWSWKHYQYGYTGSGFLWYGLNQSLLDRAFDPWSNNNESYYWQLSQSIYQKNPVLFRQILAKYDVSYIILDEYLISSGNQQALYNDEIRKLISKNPDIAQIGFFGNLSVYQIKNPNSEAYISINSNLPLIAPDKKWLDIDQAYIDFGDYISSINSDIFYPFRSLFSKRTLRDEVLGVTEINHQIVIKSAKLPTQFTEQIPDEIASDSAKLIKKDNYLEMQLDNNALVYTSDNVDVLNSNFVNNTCNPFKTGIANNQKITDQNSTYLNLSAKDQRNCLSFGIPNLLLRDAYLISVTSRNITGLPLRMSLINNTAKHIELETFLHQGNNWQTDYFIVPPLASDYLGYTFYVINDGIGNNNAENDIKLINIYQIPYNFLKEIKFIHSFNHQLTTSNFQLNSVNHPDPAEYEVNVELLMNNLQLEQKNNQVLILNQSYNDGWFAYEIPSNNQLARYFPFLFGRKLDHVLVNNWANAWVLDDKILRQEDNKTNNLTVLPSDNLTVYIVFWPQLLEFVGFALIAVPLLFVLIKSKK